jgi:hypothetical protein
MDDYVSKPIGVGELQRALAAVTPAEIELSLTLAS